MLIDYLKVSILMMRAKPVRSILSLLGIYIGVLALVIILSIGAGIRQKLTETFGTRGARVVFIHPGFDPVSKKIGTITVNDLDHLRQVPEVLSVMQRSNSELDLRAPDSTYHAKILGVDEVFVPLYRVKIIRGRSFFADEIKTKQPVCLLSSEAVRTLFPAREPVGASLEMAGLVFTVIGVVQWDSETGQRASSPEVDALVPQPWLVNDKNTMISFAEVRLKQELTAQRAIDVVTKTLSHGDENRARLFFVRSMEQFMEKSQEITGKIQLALLGIAAISLLVGGIGVANVMVTSVTERTREIGVRKALGARRIDILMQFLTEACVLSASGGLLAVATGALGVSSAQSFLEDFPLAFPVGSVAICLGLTIAIGLIAGVYPASRAASLSPAEALRYE